MTLALRAVRIIGTGSFLPGDPIPNDRLDEILGPLDKAPPRVRQFVQTMGPIMLEKSGIESRHLAIDPKTRALTHTGASLAEQACRRALDMAGCTPQDVDLLILACPVADYSTPPTSAVLQERLGIQHCAEMEIHSNCSGAGKGMQVAFDALRCGRYRRALVAYAQISSVYVRNCYFNQEKMTKTQAALRYILADGAGAVLLEASDAAAPTTLDRQLLGTHIESIGGQRCAGMTAGGGVADLAAANRQIPEMYAEGLHHLDQDFTAVAHDAAPTLIQGVQNMLAALQLQGTQIDHYISSVPTRQLYDGNLSLATATFNVGPERMKFRAARTGYCGGASILVHFDELVRSGELQPGQRAVVYSIESSKWMSGGFVTRW
jgi:3-oxoacyl-[acyl-carrier-protein] synthase III